MSVITQLLKRKVSTDAFDVACTQALCFVGGVFVMTLGFYKLSDFDLSANQILCALLMTSAVSLFMIMLGVLLPNACAFIKKTR
ncbi:MAG TPA: hypothetical protein VM821_07635 [Abditibacteriaceae bacterium]|nr:hypothetical protein [Abditibacteriaceae bacterium]